MVDELVTAELSSQVESAPPPPDVSEDVVTADTKASTKFDVDFSGLLTEPKIVTRGAATAQAIHVKMFF